MRDVYIKTAEFIRSLYPNQKFIPLHEPRFIGNEKLYVNECIDSTFVSSVGKFVDRFETEIAAYTNAKYAVACVNGTSALHISLLAAGVKKGDIVVTQALSFIATCNAISYIEAEPYFVDIDRDTLGMSVEAVNHFLLGVRMVNNEAIHIASGRRVAALVVMHTFGFPAKIDKIIESCILFNIPVIEDAAEAIGSFYQGKSAGTFGLMGIFSFNGNKTITCGGGGIVLTDNEQIAKKIKHLTTQAKLPHRWAFLHDQVGYNYRCPNINAALACAQLEQLELFVSKKRETAECYATFFSSTDLQFIREPEGCRSNYWLNSILLPSESERDIFLAYTNDNEVMTRPVWTLMHMLPMFQDTLHDGLNTSIDIASRLVNLPSSVRI